MCIRDRCGLAEQENAEEEDGEQLVRTAGVAAEEQESKAAEQTNKGAIQDGGRCWRQNGRWEGGPRKIVRHRRVVEWE